MKKILIISQYFYPEQFMITNVAKQLKKNGYSITVLTGIPNYPLGKKMDNYKNKFYSENMEGIQIKRVPIILRGKGLKMILNYFSYVFMACVKIFTFSKKFDIIYVFEVSPVTQILPAIFYKKIKNKYAKVIVNCQDIWPEVLKIYGFKEDSLIYKVGHKISDFSYTKADKILISSPLFSNYLYEQFEIENSKIKYLPNYADAWVAKVIDANLYTVHKHLVFAGNMGKTQNLDFIVHSINQCKNKEKIIVDFVGDGSELEHLKELVKNYHLENIIIFHGRKNKDELKRFYDNASAFLLTLVCENKVCYTVPSKVQGYMGAGKPIIASILGGAKDIIEKANCGIITKYNDVEEFSKVIDDFVENEEKYKVLGENGRKYFIKNYTEECYIKSLIYYLED